MNGHNALRLLAGALLAFGLAHESGAQSYPTHPIRVLLPFAGGTDAVARVLAQAMSRRFRRTVRN